MPPRNNRRRKRAPAVATVEVAVTAIGAGGDGIGEEPDGRRLYVPFTVPGDRVRARPVQRRGDGLTAALVEVLSPGPERAPPPCRHFGRCGGCSLQHLTDDAYVRWKRERLEEALKRAGIDRYRLEPLARTPPAARRRATFAAFRPAAVNAPPICGFTVRNRHDIVDVAECPVMAPRIVALLPEMRRLLAEVLLTGERCRVAVSLLDGGLDVVLELPREPDLQARERLAAFAETADLARLSVRASDTVLPEPVAQRRAPTVAFGRTRVLAPPGAFLQASAAGEAALVAAVLAAVGATTGSLTPVADLFCGAGTFALPLRDAGARVHAVDADAETLQALTATARTDAGLTIEKRDLFARPLRPQELQRFGAVVFDPPRAGAAAQARELAASAVPVIAAVSCNPSTFARDAGILTAGGYRLERVVPVDQFLWSPHLELAATFRRRAKAYAA